MAQEMMLRSCSCPTCLCLFPSVKQLLDHLINSSSCCKSYSDEKVPFKFTVSLTLCHQCVSGLRLLSANNPTNEDSYIIVKLCQFCRVVNRNIPPILRNETQ